MAVQSKAVTAIQFLGLALIASGLFLLAPWVGIVAAGVALLLFGWLMEGVSDGPA